MIGLRFPDEKIAELDAYAEKHGVSRSEAIRRLVEKGLDA